MRNTQNNNLLGICIPTYNRSDYLRKCLLVLINQVQKYELPIYISDNASTDNTKSMIEELRDQYPNIYYLRNIENIGLYRNILNVIKLAKTDYVWLMGDDDAILQHGVDMVVSTLKETYDYVVLNSIPYDTNLYKAKAEKIIDCSENIKYNKDESSSLFVDLGKMAYHGFMSSMVVKTRLLHDLIPKYSNNSFSLYGNIWLPLAIFYESIFEKHGVFLCKPVIMQRDNVRVSAKAAWDYHYLDRIKAIKYLCIQGYDPQTMRNSRDLSIVETAFIAIVSKRSNPAYKLFNNFVKTEKFFPFYIKLLILFIDLMPETMIRMLEYVVNAIRNGGKNSAL